MSAARTVGVLGGSGLYEIEGLSDVREVELATPFGAPSDAYVTGVLGGVKMVFLPRHGRGHRISPSEINFRANIWGLKQLGVSRIVSVSAVGSMREDIAPGHFVLVDQFIDRTRHRPDTFFSDGIVAHVGFADPICEPLRRILLRHARELDITVHDGGTYLNMEGPQFSTRAESRLYRQWGVDVIGMTNLQEAKLALEAEIGYATIAMSTDYDCWHEEHDDVSVESVLAQMRSNVARAKALIAAVARDVADMDEVPADHALRGAIMTDPARVSAAARARVGLFVDRYLGR
jgi:5'-methylthioadenosine phosphorylase